MVLGKNDKDTVYDAGYISVRASEDLVLSNDYADTMTDDDTYDESRHDQIKVLIISSSLIILIITASLISFRIKKQKLFYK